MSDSPQSTPPGLSPTAKRAAEMVGWSLVALMCLFFLWVLIGALSLYWLSFSVPVSDEAIRDTSWLTGASTARFVASAVGCAVFVLPMLMVLASARSDFQGQLEQLLPVGVMLLIAFLCVPPTSLESQVRVGLYEGTHKIGCFVPDTVECREMLKLPASTAAMSMYAAPGNDDPRGWTPEYRAARSAVVSDELEATAIRAAFPFFLLFRAPLFIGKGAEMRAALEKQTAELAALRARESTSTSAAD